MIKGIGNNTKVELGRMGKMSVYLHGTKIVTSKPRHIKPWGELVTLNSGGYRTPTTKRRMNEVSEEYYNAGFKVYQKNFDWYVDTDKGPLKFIDGLTFRVQTIKGVIDNSF